MKKSNILLRIFLVILPVTVAAIIFMFSAQTADISKEVSRGFTKHIIYLYWKIKGITDGDILLWTKALNALVRKYAHFTLYSALGMTTVLFFGIVVFNNWKFRTWLCAFICCVLYAASDEYHQSFVPGRGALVSDVVLDSFGALWSSLLIYFICKTIAFVVRKMRERRRA